MSLLLASLGNDATGSHALSPFAVAAAGALAFVGVGEAALSPFAVDAAGTNAPPVEAVGEAALSSFAVAASGEFVPVSIGTASAALSPFAASASASVEFRFSASSSLASFSVVAFGENRRLVDALANGTTAERPDRTPEVDANATVRVATRPARTITVNST